ncbi:MAG: CBS domain-containing protein [Polyangiaceae bacterium]
MPLDQFRSSVVTVESEDTVTRAAQIMRERHVGSLVVTHSGRPIGLVTDRDIVLRVVAEGRDATRYRIAEFLTYSPITVSVTDGIETAAARMREHGVRRLPLVDERGIAVGMVTADDLLTVLGSELGAVCEGIENRADADESR